MKPEGRGGGEGVEELSHVCTPSRTHWKRDLPIIIPVTPGLRCFNLNGKNSQFKEEPTEEEQRQYGEGGGEREREKGEEKGGGEEEERRKKKEGREGERDRRRGNASRVLRFN